MTKLPRFPLSTERAESNTIVPTFIIPIKVGVDVPEKILAQRAEFRSLADSKEIYAVRKEGDSWVILQALVGDKLDVFKVPDRYIVSHIPISGSYC
jgi:hypothetical protein